MRGLPFISIITPSLDPGAAILECLRSIRDQNYPRIEHIVIDGGSNDATVDLLESAPGLKWISESDQGQADAINKGFRMASGDLVGWLNSDDAFLPDTLETIGRAYQRHHKSEWFYGNCTLVSPSGTAPLRGPRFLTRWTFELGNRVPQPGCLVSADTLSSVGHLDPTFDLTMDFDLWLRLQTAGVRATHVSQNLALFRVHSRSKTGSIPEWRFTTEEARALAKNDRREAASVAFGRAAARKVLVETHPSKSMLPDAISDLTAGAGIDGELATAAAGVEYALRSGGTQEAIGALARGKHLHPLLMRMIAASVKSRMFSRPP